MLLLAVISGSVALAQTGEPVLVMADGPSGVEKADASKVIIDGTEWSEEPIEEGGLTLHILFKDPAGHGFRDAALGEKRRARLYDAFSYVAETLRASGALNVMIGVSESDGTGALAQGGPMFPQESGITHGSVFQRISTGTAPFPSYAEMALTFDWGYAWNLSTAAPSPDTIDLWSVAIHEITHCLGFLSLMTATGASRFSPATSTYTAFDCLLARQSPLKLLIGGTSANPVFAGGTADLTGGAAVFSGTEATSTFGASPSIYSSSPFLQGTSLQHWTEGSVPGGAVMEPRYAYGAMRRQYSAVDIAALRDIGWDGAEAPDHGPCPIQSVTLVEPSQTVIAANASNTALVQFRATVALDNSDPLCETEDNVLRVEYFVDGVSRKVSGDEGGQFPLNLTLGVGTHTVRASATRTDSAAGPVETEKTFSISADVVVVPSPKLAVAPAGTVCAFGAVNAGASADAVYTVRNSGTGTLIGAASLSGGMQFQFVGASTYSLAPGASATVTVRFTPDKKGDCAGTLSFDGNGGSVTVTLTGSGVKTGGLFNCAGVRETPGFDTADLMVALAALLALAGMHGRSARA